MRKIDILSTLTVIADDRNLQGNDLRIAIHLADRGLSRPSDLVALTGISKAHVSHSLRRLQDAGYISLYVHDEDHSRWYELAAKPQTPKRREEPQIPGQLSINDVFPPR